MDKKLNVAVYARVSTDKQELEQQIEACRKFCVYKEFEVLDVYQDVGSGKSLNRPSFFKMLSEIREMKYDGIVVFRVDRIGRSVLELANFMAEMDNKGVQVFSVNESLDRTTAIGKMTFNMIMAMAEYEREAISEATKQRLQALKERGEELGRPKGSKDRKKRKRKYFRKPNWGGGF